MALTKVSYSMITGAPVNVLDYGADSTGATDSSAAIQAAFDASANIYFPAGTYLIGTGITKTANNVLVDFGDAVLVNAGAGYMFTFGVLSNTPQNTGLVIKGGRFTQNNPATTSNLNYILVQAIKNFTIKDCVMDNVSNGGICVYAGAEAGVIDSVKINGKTGYSTIRGIWLQGSTATDWVDQYVDTNSITRNSTPFPLYAAKDIKIVNCTVIVSAYGIYLMNAWDCIIDNCYVDTSGVGSTRCIALNSYSPGSRVTNCTLISDRSCTGILITQASDNVIVSNNVFKGSFGGNRAIYVQYLAKALITNNRFTDTTTQHIAVNMGGFAHIKNNEFVRAARTADNRAVYFNAIDPASAGTTIGSTGTVLTGSGVIFENNVLDKLFIGVYYDGTIAASNGNQPAPEFVQLTGNTFMNFNLAVSASEYPLLCGGGSSGNVIQVRYERNVLYPYTQGYKNQPQYAGTDYFQEAGTNTMALFEIAVAAGGGAITTTRLAGNNFSCNASRSGASLLVYVRTDNGGPSAQIPRIVSMTNQNGATVPFTFTNEISGFGSLIKAYDSTGAQISFATAGITFNLLAGPQGSGT